MIWVRWIEVKTIAIRPYSLCYSTLLGNMSDERWEMLEQFCWSSYTSSRSISGGEEKTLDYKLFRLKYFWNHTSGFSKIIFIIREVSARFWWIVLWIFVIYLFF